MEGKGKKKVNSGRKTLLNKKMIERAGEIIAEGNYAIVACQLLGISQASYYEYLKRGNEDIESGVNSLYSEFSETIKEAEARAEADAVGNIKTAARNGTWQASAWLLERKHRERWGARAALEVTGKEGGPIEVDSPRERIERRINSIVKRNGTTEDMGQSE